MKNTCKACGKVFVSPRASMYCCKKCRDSRRNKQTTRKQQHKKLSEDKARAVELYYSEYSPKEIARIIGRCDTVVYTAWREAGLPKRLTPLQKKVKRLREKGMCSTEIADALGKSSRNISAICDAIGMPFTDEERQQSRLIGSKKAIIAEYGTLEERDEHRRKRVAEKCPGWTWIAGSLAENDRVKIQCDTCKTIVERSAITIRGKCGIDCPTCKEKERQRQQEQKEQERIKEEQKKIEAFWGQKFQQLNMQAHKCKECGIYYFGGKAGYCSEGCRRKHTNRKHDKRIDRAKRIDKSISLKKLYKRDKGICWLCGGKCDYKDYSKDENGNFIVGTDYPSIDHVYPLSKGGDHVWSNVRLAHHYCNILKSNKVVAYG